MKNKCFTCTPDLSKVQRSEADKPWKEIRRRQDSGEANRRLQCVKIVYNSGKTLENQDQIGASALQIVGALNILWEK